MSARLTILNKYSILFYFTLTSCASGYAQELLTLQQAIETALKNNYGIFIAKSNSAIAANNNTLGNSGFLPQVVLNASNNQSITNTKQNYVTGLGIDRKNAGSTTVTAGPTMVWTLFDGMKMFATREKYKQMQEQGELGIKIEIENDLAKVIVGYFNIVQQYQLITAMYESVKVSEERIKIAQKKLDVGSGSRLDLLQAKVDLNTQKSGILKLKADLTNFKAVLNQLLVRSNETDFRVSDSIPLNTKISYTDLKSSIPKQSDSLLFMQKNILISDQFLKEMNSLRLPQIGMNATYNFAKTINQVGFVLVNQNLGWNGGLTLTWNLFNGLKTDILYKNAQQQVLISKFQYDQTQKQIETSLLKAWNNYQYALEALALEEENSAISRENLSIALERFRLGNATNVDINLAQKSFEDAISRLVGARFGAKVSETTLLKLNGDLVR